MSTPDPALAEIAATGAPYIGPPPVMSLMCFPCVTGTCGHRDRLAGTHGGGLVPALTIHNGTALCLDCASKEAGDADPL